MHQPPKTEIKIPLDVDPTDKILAILQETVNKDIVLGERTELVGGISNRIYRQDTSHGNMVLRIFGDNTDLFIDRERELSVCIHFNQYNIGPKILAIFGNGRAESFLTGVTLKAQDLQNDELNPVIAAEIARLHRTPIPESLTASFWNLVDGWLVLAADLKTKPGQEQFIATMDLPRIKQELEVSRQFFAKCKSPTTMSHNDLLCGNFVLDTGNVVRLLDFEYAMPNLSCFDLANHWNEWPGFDAQLTGDWSTFPSPTQQVNFCTHYLRGYLGREPSEDEVSLLRKETLACTVTSNLFWGLWSILQAAFSSLDFDYPSYGVKRIERARATKEWLNL